jgi:hypothetical protein
MDEVNKYGQYKILNGKLSISDVIVRFFNDDNIDAYYVDDNGEFILDCDRKYKEDDLTK